MTIFKKTLFVCLIDQPFERASNLVETVQSDGYGLVFSRAFLTGSAWVKLLENLVFNRVASKFLVPFSQILLLEQFGDDYHFILTEMYPRKSWELD